MAVLFRVVVVVVVTRPLSRDGNMVGDHKPPEIAKLFRPRPEAVKRKVVAKKQAAQRIRSWTVQNEITHVPRVG